VKTAAPLAENPELHCILLLHNFTTTTVLKQRLDLFDLCVVVASLQAIRRPPIADSMDYTHKQYDMNESSILVQQASGITHY